MSLVSGRFLIGYIVALLLLVHLKASYAFEQYLQYVTNPPEIISCGFNMQCVPQRICINNTIMTAGETKIEVRTVCPSGEVCCRINTDDSSEEVISNETPSTYDGCGYRNQDGVGTTPRRIPHQSEFGEFPWMLLILSNNQKGGGSLIHPKIALTAAHIVADKAIETLVVRAGAWTIQGEDKKFPHQDREVLELIIHEGYNKGTLFNDIALLFLRTAFELKPHINTICLPPTQPRPDYVNCFATGWGISIGTKVSAIYLKKISLSVVPNRRCQQLLRRTYLSYFFELHNSFMCAGGVKGQDTCYGDGGSPLVCPIPVKNGRYYQVGVVSWGLEDICGSDNIPGVYANMAHLRDWVYKTVTDKRFDPNAFTAS